MANSKFHYSSLFVSVVDENNNLDFSALGIEINKGLAGSVRLHSFQFLPGLNGVILVFETEAE